METVAGIARFSFYDEKKSYNPKGGLVGGGFLTIYFYDYVGVQVELLYAAKGAGDVIEPCAEYGSDKDEFEITHSLDYI